MPTPDPFLQALRDSGLVPPEQLAAHRAPPGDDADRLADRLVRAGLLTPFQALGTRARGEVFQGLDY